MSLIGHARRWTKAAISPCVDGTVGDEKKKGNGEKVYGMCDGLKKRGDKEFSNGEQHDGWCERGVGKDHSYLKPFLATFGHISMFF